MIQSNWAVLLCKFSDDASEPFDRDYYEDLFTSTGNGSQNMVDFFRDVSHGNIDTGGSQVFGWYTFDQKFSDYTGSGANQAGRQELIDWAREAAIADGVKLSNFVGVVVCMNVPTDLFGGGSGVVCDNGTTEPRQLGQEMGHLYGLDHSRVDGSAEDYQDPWDAMSTAAAFSAPHPRYAWIGPGLNAANMAGRGWLDQSRVWTASGRSFETVVRLRPLFRRDLPGFLVAVVDGYYIEFRNKEGWDAGVPRPAVLIHRFEDNRSYLMPARNGERDLVAGSVFRTADLASPFVAPFRPQTTVKVLEINSNEQFATIRLHHQAAFREPSLGPAMLFGGVAEGGDGFIFVGGKILRVPPRSPIYPFLEQLAAYATSDAVNSIHMRTAVRREMLSTIVALAEKQMRTMLVFRQPARAFEEEEHTGD